MSDSCHVTYVVLSRQTTIVMWLPIAGLLLIACIYLNQCHKVATLGEAICHLQSSSVN